MKLNIYENKKIVKTYTADSYDLPFGVVEDIAEVIDLDQLKTGSDAEIIKLVGKALVSSISTIKQLMKDVFDGLTDEELKKTTVKDITACVMDIIAFTLAQLNLGGKAKN